mgnify:CR=1 FL=1
MKINKFEFNLNTAMKVKFAQTPKMKTALQPLQY